MYSYPDGSPPSWTAAPILHCLSRFSPFLVSRRRRAETTVATGGAAAAAGAGSATGVSAPYDFFPSCSPRTNKHIRYALAQVIMGAAEYLLRFPRARTSQF